MLDRFEQFSYSISNIYKHIMKIERDEMEKYGLRGSYVQYLIAMTRFPEGITSSKLSEICDKDKAAISRIVSEMENRGLVTRETDKNNLYRAKLVLTPEGRRAAQIVRAKAKLAVEQATVGLRDEDRAVMYACLETIGANLKKISEDGITFDNV